MDDDVSTLLHFVICVLGRDELKLNERLLIHLFKPKTLDGISPVFDPENMDYVILILYIKLNNIIYIYEDGYHLHLFHNDRNCDIHLWVTFTFCYCR